MTPNLHELANTPGAGNAAKALREAGFWQDRTDDDLPIWRVEVEVTIQGTVSVTVAAKDEAAARIAAETWCDEHPDLAASFDDYAGHEYEALGVTVGNAKDIIE